jgi:predicted lactoylglutathione lyase
MFLNLPVKDLSRTKEFFAGLGFAYEPKFTDDNAACMPVGSDAFVMLLREEFFRTFTKRPLGDAMRETPALVALSCESRAEVDALHEKALASGGTPAMDPQDHGFMYVRSFHDPDGHHWELFWMDPAAAPPG